MRKMFTMVAAIAVVLPVSVAGAAKPVAPPAKAQPGKGKVHTCKADKAKKSVTYIIRGVLTQDATEAALVVDVTSVNSHAKKALAGSAATGGGAYSAPMVPVAIGPCTHISRSGKGASKRSWTTLKAGDRVVVAFSAKRGTAYADLGTARRVVDKGPAK
jgi:hypothetical protein